MDGSYLTRVYPTQTDQHAQRHGEQVRVVEYQIDDGPLSDVEQRYRLLCTILEPEQAPAGELGVLYHERRELENTLDELKVHQRGLGWCCAQNSPTVSTRRPTATCAPTTRSAD